MKVLLTMFFLLVILLPLHPDITETSTLPDLLAAAALQNPGLKASFEQWQAALQRIPQVRALPNPQVSYAYFIRAIETRVGPQQHKAGFMQMFPWFGKLKLKGSAAAEAANAAGQRYENQKLALFYKVKAAYFNYYLTVRTAEILNENIRLLEHGEHVIESKYRTGMAPYSSLIKIQVERDKLQDRLKSTIDRLVPVKAELNGALNRPADAILPTPGELPETGFVELSRDALAEWVKTNNPGLKSMDYMAAASQLGIKVARKNYYPDFSIGLDYMFTGQAVMPGAADSGKDPLAAMISLRLPVWSKKNKAAVKEADAKHRSTLLQRKEAENNLLTRLEVVLFKYRDAQRKKRLYQKSLLPKARQAMEVTQSAFEAGKASFLDFIDSQRTMLAFELKYEEAKARGAQRIAELQMLTGREDLK